MKKILFAIGCALALFSCKKSAGIDEKYDLKGTKWWVKKITKAGKSSLATGDYLLQFENNSTFRLNLDVNQAGGNWANAAAGEIDFAGGATEICCDSEFAENLLPILNAANRYFVEDGEFLKIWGEDSVVLQKK